MAITKETVVDKIEILEQGQLQVRTATKLMEDGKELTRTYHRHVLDPSNKASGSWADTDISGEATRVQAVANATWTDAVKKAYQDMKDAEGNT